MIMDSYLDGLIKEIQDTKASRNEWEDDIDEAYRLRVGQKDVEKRDFPYPNAPNIFINIVDNKLDVKKSAFHDLLRPHPVCQFVPIGGEDDPQAVKFEKFYDWMCSYRMPSYRDNLFFAMDSMLMDSFSFIRVAHTIKSEFRTRRFTKDHFPEELYQLLEASETEAFVRFIEIVELPDTEDGLLEAHRAFKKFRDRKFPIDVMYEDELYRGPEWLGIRAIDVLVPNDTMEMENAEWIDHRRFMRWREVSEMAARGIYKDIDKIKDAEVSKIQARDDDAYTSEQDHIGVRDIVDDNLYELHDLYYWREEKGHWQRRVATYEISTNEVLRDMPLQYRGWPFVQLYYKIKGPGFYQKASVPTLLKDIQHEINEIHNNRSIYNDYYGKPMFRCSKSTNLAGLRLIPGQVINDEKFEMISNPNPNVALEREEQLLLNHADRVTHTSPSVSGTESSPMNARTATQVTAMMQMLSQGASLEAGILVNQLAKAHKMTWEIWYEFGDREEYSRILNEPFPQMALKDIQNKYDITPATDIDGMNKVLKMQKMQMVFETLRQVPGVDLMGMARWYVSSIDPNAVKFLPDTPMDYQREAENQINEIGMMALGYEVPVKDTDNHQAHADVLAGHLGDQTKLDKNEDDTIAKIYAHLDGHLQYLQKQGKKPNMPGWSHSQGMVEGLRQVGAGMMGGGSERPNTPSG